MELLIGNRGPTEDGQYVVMWESSAGIWCATLRYYGSPLIIEYYDSEEDEFLGLTEYESAFYLDEDKVWIKSVSKTVKKEFEF